MSSLGGIHEEFMSLSRIILPRVGGGVGGGLGVGVSTSKTNLLNHSSRGGFGFGATR